MTFFSLPIYFYMGSIIILFSCNSSTSSNKTHKDQKARGAAVIAEDNTDADAFKAHLAPSAGSRYMYVISNESATELEVNGKAVDVLHKSDVDITYDVQKDSAGNFLLQMHYDKIHLYNKTGDKETELDAANPEATLDPTEKMLGVLKNANISATITPTGKVVAIEGYKELGEKILAGFKDEATRNMAKGQWEKIIGDGMVKKSLEQLFSVLPESAKQAGDTWQKNSKQKGEVDMNVASTFKLKDVEDGIATIESEGEITSDKGEANFMGYSVTSDLKGDHEGAYEVDLATGMVLKNKTTSKLKGNMHMMGKEIPVTIQTSVTMHGKKVN